MRGQSSTPAADPDPTIPSSQRVRQAFLNRIRSDCFLFKLLLPQPPLIQNKLQVHPHGTSSQPLQCLSIHAPRAHPIPAILASALALSKRSTFAPASGTLHLQFPLPRMPWPRSSRFADLSSDGTSSKKSSLLTLAKMISCPFPLPSPLYLHCPHHHCIIYSYPHLSSVASTRV